MAYQVAIGKRQIALLEQVLAVKDLVDNNQISLVELNIKIERLQEDFRSVEKLWSKWEEKLVEDDSPDFANIADNVWYKFQNEFRDNMHKFDLHKAILAEAKATSAGAILPSPIKLPQIKLLTFGGNALDWENFWQCFKTHIHENPGIPNVSKYQYLADNLTGHPRKIVDNFRATSDGYEGAIASLLDLYANPNHQRNIAFDKLLKLRTPQANYTSILEFRIEVEGLCNQLTELKVDTEHPIISRIIQNRIPEDLMQKIYKETQLYPTLKDIQQGLKVILERNDFGKGPVEQVKNPNKGKPTTTVKATATTAKPNSDKAEQPATTTPGTIKGCVYCGGGHAAWRCTRYTDLPSRKAQLSKLGRCSYCCRTHAGPCAKLAPCNRCHRAHHTWLHVDPAVNTVHTNTLGVGEQTSTALPTAIVGLLNKPNSNSQGQHIWVRALLDECSQRSFISKWAVDKLKLKPVAKLKLDLSGFLTSKSGQMYDVVKVTVRMGSCHRKIDVVVRDTLDFNIVTPGLKATADKLRNLGVKLADSYKTDNISDIGLLIGADHYDKFVEGSKKVQNIKLLKTSGGGIISGPLKVPNLKGAEVLSITVCKLGVQTPLDELDFNDEIKQTHRLWELDNIGIGLKDEITVEEGLAYSNYLDSVAYEGGQYWVKLPFRTDRPDLPTNYRTALAQLKNLVRKLGNTPENLVNYDKIIHEYLDLGFVETVPVDARTNEIHYLPHHGVAKDSVSTPLRIVFNASSKMRGTSSLNDCLMTGPNLTEKLENAVLKFRSGKYGYTADISKAFLRIGLKEEHRDYTRFLWIKDLGDESSPLMELRFKSVLFGATSSPFLLQATLDYHFNKAPDSIRDVVKGGFYVDNFLGNSDDASQLRQIYTEANKLLKEANMPLQQWTSNSVELKNLIVETENPADQVNVLGLKWDTLTDTLSISTPTWDNKPLTKRSLLSQVSSIFDPLGLITPLTIQGKMLIRQAWQTKLDWDTPLPEELKINWEEVKREFFDLESINFPRTTMSQDSVYNLHVFCDASKLAYGAVAYIEQNGEINMLTSKAKVAPLKERTLPQLELTALLIGARLVKHILDTMVNQQVGEIYLWSDNEPCLQWVKNDQCRIVYVKNRVNEIIRLQEAYPFKLLHVPTKGNPADLLSRGLTRKKFEESIWFKGPEWLCQRSQWPTQKEHVATFEINTEIQPQIEVRPFFINIKDYSDWTKLIRVMKLVIKFINSCKQRLGQPILDMTPAQYLFLQSQKEQYPLIRSILKNEIRKPQSHPSNKMISDLGLYIDHQNLIRCRGRLEFAKLGDGAKFPYLLPGKSDVARLWVSYTHQRLHHTGVNETLSSIRQVAWIPKGRQIIRGILRHCVICNRIQGPLLTQPGPPPLPFF